MSEIDDAIADYKKSRPSIMDGKSFEDICDPEPLYYEMAKGKFAFYPMCEAQIIKSCDTLDDVFSRIQLLWGLVEDGTFNGYASMIAAIPKIAPSLLPKITQILSISLTIPESDITKIPIAHRVGMLVKVFEVEDFNLLVKNGKGYRNIYAGLQIPDAAKAVKTQVEQVVKEPNSTGQDTTNYSMPSTT